MRASRTTPVISGLLIVVAVADGLAGTSVETGAGQRQDRAGRSVGTARQSVGTAHAAAAVRTAAAAKPASRTVTSITGDRVRLTTVDAARAGGGRTGGPSTVAALEPAVGSPPTSGLPLRARVLSVGDRTYVVPGAAMPYVGRQLDLDLFDISRPSGEIEVSWAPGATPRALPGLTLRETPEPGVAQVADPAAGQASDPPVGTTAPPVDPAYPQATLVIRGIDALGGPARSAGVPVGNADEVLRFGSLPSFTEGEVAFSVPVGTSTMSDRVQVGAVAAQRCHGLPRCGRRHQRAGTGWRHMWRGLLVYGGGGSRRADRLGTPAGLSGLTAP